MKYTKEDCQEVINFTNHTMSAIQQKLESHRPTTSHLCVTLSSALTSYNYSITNSLPIKPYMISPKMHKALKEALKTTLRGSQSLNSIARKKSADKTITVFSTEYYRLGELERIKFLQKINLRFTKHLHKLTKEEAKWL